MQYAGCCYIDIQYVQYIQYVEGRFLFFILFFKFDEKIICVVMAQFHKS